MSQYFTLCLEYDLRSPLQNKYAGVVARAVTEPVEVSSLCGGGWARRGSPFEARRRCVDDHRACRNINGLFESVLSESFRN